MHVCNYRKVNIQRQQFIGIDLWVISASFVCVLQEVWLKQHDLILQLSHASIKLVYLFNDLVRYQMLLGFPGSGACLYL